MSRYLDAKCRLCRREGAKLFLKGDRCNTPKCPVEKKGAVPPGQHGMRRNRRRASEYGIQLREKQKLKRIYGISEDRLKTLFTRAKKEKGSTGEALLGFLERRLDNVVYRLGFTPSRSVARQIVSHGHVLVNGKMVNIASYRVDREEVISLKTKASKVPEVKSSLDQKEIKIPGWLEKKGGAGRVSDLPGESDFPQDINIHLIIEYYSR